MTISNEAIEAAAKILYQTSVNRHVQPFERALELSKAEVRPILEAAAPIIRAEALDEVADHLDQPRILWWGDEGAKVADSPDNPRKFIKLTAWLRARAVVERGGQ